MGTVGLNEYLGSLCMACTVKITFSLFTFEVHCPAFLGNLEFYSMLKGRSSVGSSPPKSGDPRWFVVIKGGIEPQHCQRKQNV